jgi:glycosyltransferase involved in cell wall biosynthesis
MVLKRTYAVHVSSPYAMSVFDRILPFPMAAKTWVIPHVASWSGPIADGSSVLPKGHWLVHIGTITPERVSTGVLEGIRVACRSMPGRFDGLLCIGNVTSRFTRLVRQLDIPNNVIVTGCVPHDAALAAVRGASALLLIEANMVGSPFLPSKFVDYACSGKPIVAVTPSRSQTRDYLQMYGGGYAASHNPREIAAAIEQTFADLRASTARSCDAARTYRDLFSPEAIGCAYGRLLAARPS